MGSCVQFHFIVACTSEKSADQKLLENNYNIPFKDSRPKKPTMTTGSVSIMASRAINLDIIFVLTKCKSIIKFILSRWFLPLISQSHEKPNSSKARTRNFTDTKRGRSASSTPSRLRWFAGVVVGVLFPHLSNE